MLVEPTQRIRGAGLLLLPDLLEGLNGGYLVQPVLRFLGPNPGEQLDPILPDCLGQSRALMIGIGQAIVLGAMIRAQHPVGRHMRPDPVGRDDRECVERMPHRFDDKLEPIEVPNRPQHMRGVGALPSPRG
jgi:hypothetical protein